jgi:hypothetical protein
MREQTMITGGCLCGAVRYKSTEPPITARICWCRVCQYIGAGGAAVRAAFKLLYDVGFRRPRSSFR